MSKAIPIENAEALTRLFGHWPSFHDAEVLTNHTLVTLRFTNLLLRELRWFNAQNSLFQIDMGQVEPSENEGRTISVSFDSNDGVEASFLCDRVIVQSVAPFLCEANP